MAKNFGIQTEKGLFEYLKNAFDHSYIAPYENEIQAAISGLNRRQEGKAKIAEKYDRESLPDESLLWLKAVNELFFVIPRNFAAAEKEIELPDYNAFKSKYEKGFLTPVMEYPNGAQLLMAGAYSKSGVVIAKTIEVIEKDSMLMKTFPELTDHLKELGIMIERAGLEKPFRDFLSNNKKQQAAIIS